VCQGRGVSVFQDGPPKLPSPIWQVLFDNLRRLAGVSGAGARCRNPERSEGSGNFTRLAVVSGAGARCRNPERSEGSGNFTRLAVVSGAGARLPKSCLERSQKG